MPTPTIAPVVVPSGQGVFFPFADGAGKPSVVTDVVPNNAVQSVTVLDLPAGYASTLPMALTFRGQATATVTATTAAPDTYFQWNLSGLSAGSFDLAVNLAYFGGTGSPTVWYEVFGGVPSGATYLGRFVLNQASATSAIYGGPANPAPFADGTLTGSGAAVQWYPLGRFAISGTTLAVRVSCPPTSHASVANDSFQVDHLRVAKVGGSAVLVDNSTGPGTFAGSTVDRIGSVSSDQVAGTTSAGRLLSAFGRGAGPRYALDPADLRAKLSALATIGAGNVAVTGSGTATDPALVTFGGPLAGLSLPEMTSSLGPSHVAILTAAAGGIRPVLTITRGGVATAVPAAATYVHWHRAGRDLAGVHCHFLQAPPAVTYAPVGQHDGTYAGPGWDAAHAGYGGQAMFSAGSGATATYVLRPVKACTLEPWVTWPAAPGRSTSVTFTVTEFKSGATLGTYTVDQTVAPSGPPDGGLPYQRLGSFSVPDSGGLVVVQSNGTGSPMVADAVKFVRTSADDSVRVLPGDVVTYSAGAGWATSVYGPAPAAANQPVANLVGGAIYPPLPASATMVVGWNLTGMGTYSSVYYEPNLLRGVNGFVDYSSGHAVDAYPATLPGATLDVRFTDTAVSFRADRKNWANVPPGNYDLYWDGAANLEAYTSFDLGGVVTETGATTWPAPGGVNNRRSYTLAGDVFHYGPSVGLRFHGLAPVGDGTYTCDVRNARLYPAGTDPANPPDFLPAFLAKMPAGSTIRNLDTLGAIAANPTTYDDYNPAVDTLSRNTPTRSLTAAVSRIEQYTGPLDFDGTQGVALLLTTAAPHGLAAFQYCQLSDYSGTLPTLTNGLHTQAMPGGMADRTSSIYAVTPTTLVLFLDPHAETVGGVLQSPWRMTTPLVGGGVDFTAHVRVTCGTGFPLRRMVALCNAKASDLYFNTAFCATRDALTRCGAYVGQNLAPGLKLLVECSNESWNPGPPPYTLASNGSRVFYGGSATDDTAFTCEMSKLHWDWMLAGWTSAGRSATDFVRVMGTNHANIGTTQQRASYCHAKGYGFDMVVGAPYLDNTGSTGALESDFADLTALLTADQHLDHWEANYTYSGYADQVPGHLAALRNPSYGGMFASTVYASYEGGPDLPLVQSSGLPNLNYGEKGHAVWRHPRFYGILTHILRVYQDSGMSRFHVFQLAGVDNYNGQPIGWPAYPGTGVPAYAPGDPAQDAIQVGTPDRIDLIKSVTGGVVLGWAARLGAAPPPPPPPPTSAPAATGLRPRPGYLRPRGR